MLNEVAVIIPYYHNDLSEYEKISYAQGIRVLGKYPVILVVPDDFADEDLPKNENIMIERVPKEWFTSIASYNEMMMNIEFYLRFQQYKYILIYQLDAFVFSDKLLEMCEYDYDYIGAPWIRGYFYYIDETHSVWRVGNGGFSLRKVQSFIELLKKGGQDTYYWNEDVFYAISSSSCFTVAPVEVALKFAFEQEIEKCFERTNGELPFGCHAWERYNLKCLAPIINSYGYEVNGETAENEDDKLENIYRKEEERSYFFENEFSIAWFKQSLLASHTKMARHYVVWGAGYYGRMLVRMLQEAGFFISQIVDSNPDNNGKKIGEIMITNSMHHDTKEQEVIIIAIKNRGQEVANILNEKGYCYKKDYVFLTDIINI